MKTKNTLKRLTLSLCALVLLTSVILPGKDSLANMKAPPPEVAGDIIIVGDRVVDIAYNLGVLPKAMSVRGSMWKMAKKLKTSSQILGCPNYITKNEDVVPKAIKKFGIKRLIIEKNASYCLYKPKVNPTKIIPLIEATGVTIEYVDFSKGLESAIHQTAKLLGREDKAGPLFAKYTKKMDTAKKKLPANPTGGKAVILNGTFQPSTGKIMLRVEAPGGYSDMFMLEKLGYTNAGDVFKPADGKSSKGHYPVKKTKNGVNLKPLIEANPDVIIITGDTLGAQMALSDTLARHPEFSQISAVKNLKIFALPRYVDSSILEYPGMLMKWTAALTP